jgi:hypothetical protein
VATVNTTGLATALSTGSSTISATLSGQSGNATLTATPGPTTVSVWNASTVPTHADGGADNPVQLGLKFRTDVNGTITAIRFYKSAANTGTHVGNLWTDTGTLLGSVTFTSESGSGWQQASFATPISITAGTVYVASYQVNAGHYSADLDYFASAGVDNPPIHALGSSGPNGVYRYSSSTVFPNLTFRSANYWVDVVFKPAP